MTLINGKTQLIGLLGWPVAHSKSPQMHNAASAALGLDWAYVPFPVREEDVKSAVRGLRALGVRGVNVTVPHKQAVMPHLDVIAPAAQVIGAVNTIVFARSAASQHSTAHGYNTDWQGFLADLQSYEVAIKERGCLILGAGGSARAVAYALASVGGRVHLLARRIVQSREVAHAIGKHFPHEHVSYHELGELPQIASQWAAPLIVNTTPLGMLPRMGTTPWPDEVPFPEGSFVYDLVYNPAETRLIKQARAAGCRAENGLGMLVYQGAIAFKLWTGKEPDTALMFDQIRP